MSEAHDEQSRPRSSEHKRVVTLPERYRIIVLLPVGEDWRQYEVEGRVARWIAWLIMHRPRIERIGTGALTFNVGLRQFQPEIKERYPSQPDAPDNPHFDPPDEVPIP